MRTDTTATRNQLTPLQRQLSGARTDPPTALDAFKMARATFQAGHRVDMNRIATDLGINRATLYRWVGSREQLLTEVLWSLTSRTLERELDHPHPDAPGSRLASILTNYNQAVLTHQGMTRFLEEEGEFALRLLTVQSGFQLRLVTHIADLINTETAAARLAPTVPTEDLAFIVVRIIESYVYRKVITGEHPDPTQAPRILQALLPAPNPPKPRRSARPRP